MRKWILLIILLVTMPSIVTGREVNFFSTKVDLGLRDQVGRAGRFNWTTYEDQTYTGGTPVLGTGRIYVVGKDVFFIDSDGTVTSMIDTTGTLGGELGINLISTTNDILSDNGTVILGGTGGTNNENISFDFETTANQITVATTTSVSDLLFSSLNLDIRAAAGSAGTTTLSTGELTVVAGNKLGQIDFQAPLESDGSDANLVGASIHAEAAATFDGTTNTTDIVLSAANSETAAEKVRITGARGGVVVGSTEGIDSDQQTIAGVLFDLRFSTHSDRGITTTFDFIGDFGFFRHKEGANELDGALLFGLKSRGTEASPTVVADGDVLFSMFGGGYDGTDYATSGAIRYVVDGAPGSDDMPGRIEFETTPDGAGSPIEAMRITSQQRLGLGTTLPSTIFHVDSNAADTVAIATIENTGGDFQVFRDDADPEGVITGSPGDLLMDTTNGIGYIKHTGSASNTGWVLFGGVPTFKSYSLSNPGSSDTFYIGGHYGFASADATLTIGGTVIQTFGAAGEAHGSHAFAVASGAGGTDLVLTVTGVSITDAGVKNDADSEIIVADTDTATLNQYFETSKKWLGQITYTLTGSSGAFTFNYGFVKYEDFGNKDFNVTDFEGTGEARANETGLNIELLHHEATAFLYHATAFVPNQTALVDMATDYGTNNDVASGDGFAYKRTGLSTAVAGGNGEGVIIRVTTSTNNSINDASFHIGVLLK